MAFNSFIYNNQPMTFNGFAIGSGYVPPAPPTPVYNISAGWTIRTTGALRRVVATMDPAGGTSKTIYETITQLNDNLTPMEGGFVSSFRGSDVWANDQYAAFAPSAGIYNSVWDNASSYSANTSQIFCNFGASNTANITDVYTMDFFNQAKEIGTMRFFGSTSSLPQKAENIISAIRITSLNQSFSGFTNVKTPVIPFITACIAAMPSLTSINRPLINSCTLSPDYELATAQYPGWF